MLTWLLTRSAFATWLIVASDSATTQLGGAGTSCVGSLDVSILFAAAPGAGAIHAQAAVNVEGRDRGAALLGQGATPAEVIAAITDPSFDGSASSRQYGVVDLFGGAAGFTGSTNGDWAGDVQGTVGTFTYSAQGNILTGPQVVTRTEQAFVDSTACDLAEKLMESITAGEAAGEGDSRCTPDGIPSDSAFIRVIDGQGTPLIDLSVTDTAPEDPLVRLRQRFDDWRTTHPCPSVEETGSTGTTGDTGPVDPTSPTGDDTAGDTAPPETPPPTQADGGCGCGHSGAAGVVPVLLAALLVLRRPQVLLLLLLGGCGKSILPLYNAAKDAALTDPGAPAASWTPDAVLQLSGPLVRDLIKTAALDQGALSTPIAVGAAQVVPDLRLKSLKVVPTRPCEGGCIGLDAVYGGTLHWTAGPLKGSAPVSAHGAVDAVFEVVEEKGVFVVTAAPRRLRDLEVDLGDVNATIKSVDREIRALIESEGLSRVPPVAIARFPRSRLPIRAIRLEPDGRSLQIALLTDVPDPGQVTAGAAPAEGFAVTLAEQTLLALARAEAFRHGPVGYGVVPEPTSLSFTKGGFTLGLRLWRIEGRGWWRDYTIAGTAKLAGGKLNLVPKDVVEGGKSPGAVVADPLAALAEGLILKAIEDAVRTSLPLSSEQNVGGLPVDVALEQLDPAGGAIVGTGSVALGTR